MQERLERAGVSLAARGGRRVLLRPADEVLGDRPRQDAVGDLHPPRRPRPSRRRAVARGDGPRRGATGQRTGRPPVVYEHRLLTPVPERLPFGDATVDEVRLRGSLNTQLDAATQAAVGPRGAARVKAGRPRFRPHAGRRPGDGQSRAARPRLLRPIRTAWRRRPFSLIESAGFGGVRHGQIRRQALLPARGRGHARAAIGGIQISELYSAWSGLRRFPGSWLEYNVWIEVTIQ